MDNLTKGQRSLNMARIKRSHTKAKYEIKPEIEEKVELIIQTPKKKCCPYCQSEKLIARGKRKTKMGEKQ